MAKKISATQPPPAVRQSLRELGEMIAASRKERKFSQAELATRVGVSRLTIHRIEQGLPEVGIGHYLTAAWMLGLPVLIWSDYSHLRPTSSLSAFLLEIQRQLPQRIRPGSSDDDNAF